MDDEEIGKLILNSAMKIHTVLGPGLLESAYEACVAYELMKCGLEVKRQVVMPLKYDGIELDIGYRLDIFVGDRVIVEIKAAEKLLPIHTAQLLTYLRLSKRRLGFLLNFNVAHMKDGLKRVVNGF
ncbi:MAG: GxxExxY protein [Burkholderiales bacterium]|nr:GxxExxY protein [Burkholderiales bacterium]